MTWLSGYIFVSRQNSREFLGEYKSTHPRRSRQCRRHGGQDRVRTLRCCREPGGSSLPGPSAPGDRLAAGGGPRPAARPAGSGRERLIGADW